MVEPSSLAVPGSQLPPKVIPSELYGYNFSSSNEERRNDTKEKPKVKPIFPFNY